MWLYRTQPDGYQRSLLTMTSPYYMVLILAKNRTRWHRLMRIVCAIGGHRLDQSLVFEKGWTTTHGAYWNALCPTCRQLIHFYEGGSNVHDIN